jgi:hypothetical protein
MQNFKTQQKLEDDGVIFQPRENEQLSQRTSFCMKRHARALVAIGNAFALEIT